MLPRRILEKAVQLKDPLKRVYIALYTIGKPASAQEIAELVGCSRAYASMRLCQLVDMNLVKRSKSDKTVTFEIRGG